MHDRQLQEGLQDQVYGWFDSPLGRSLQAFEVNRLREVLPRLYGTVAVQVGRIGKLDVMDACVTPTRIVLDVCTMPAAPEENNANGGRGDCVGAAGALPLESGSVDVALLPHTLDFCRDPHQALREVNRVLAAEGHAVILGFNPLSFWGLRRLFTPRPSPVPWCANFLRLGRVKDWLALFDFELTHGSMLYYRPPLQRSAIMDRLHFLDKMGDRWWPMIAAAYLVVAKKRVAGMTPLRVAWKTPRVMKPGGEAAPVRRIASARIGRNRAPLRRVRDGG